MLKRLKYLFKMLSFLGDKMTQSVKAVVNETDYLSVISKLIR